jgi:hypothetical protein
MRAPLPHAPARTAQFDAGESARCAKMKQAKTDHHCTMPKIAERGAAFPAIQIANSSCLDAGFICVGRGTGEGPRRWYAVSRRP